MGRIQLTKEGVVAPLAVFSSGLLAPPKLNDPIGAAAFLPASLLGPLPVAPPKLNDPIGAGAAADLLDEEAESLGLVLEPPKLKLPRGAGADLSVAAGVAVLDEEPKENGAGSFLAGASAALGSDDPKEKGVGAATIGVAVPELPKKLGTSPPSVAGGVVVDVGGADGLPSPKLNAGFFDASVDPNSADGAGGLATGVLEPDKEKKPFSSGLRDAWGFSFAEPVESGESGCATIELPAKGEEARGREALRRESGPAEARGTPNPEEPEPVDAAGVPLSLTGAAAADAAGEGAGASTPKLPKLMPEKEGSEIFVCSNSSMSGKSSSLAEYRPPAVGEVAREPCAEAP